MLAAIAGWAPASTAFSAAAAAIVIIGAVIEGLIRWRGAAVGTVLST